MKFIKIISLFITLNCCVFVPTQAMEWCTNTLYSCIVPVVNIAQTMRSTFLFLALIQLKDKKSQHLHSRIIQQRLVRIETNIRSDKKSAIQALTRQHNITDEQLKNILSLISQNKQYQQQYTTSAHEEVVHDTSKDQLTYYHL